MEFRKEDIDPSRMYTLGDLADQLPFSRNTLKAYQEGGFWVPPSVKVGNIDYFFYLQLLYLKATLTPALKKLFTSKRRGCKVIAIHNTKGGVAKTATAINLSFELASRGYKTCLIDADPQDSTSVILGSREFTKGHLPDDEKANLKNLIFQTAAFSDVCKQVSWEVDKEIISLTLIPSGRSLRTIDTELYELPRRYEQLGLSVINPLRDHFDFVVIDTPQAFTQMGLNVLCESDYLVIPTMASPEPFDVFIDIFRSLLDIQDSGPRGLNHPILLAGILITNYGGRTISEKEYHDLIRHMFGKRCFDTTIPSRTMHQSANDRGLPVSVFDPTSDLSLAYKDFASELITRIEGPFDV